MQFHIVKCQKMFTHDERLCIVMDFADGGDLYDLIATQRRHIRQRGSGYFPERSIVSWFIQLCCGLKHTGRTASSTRWRRTSARCSVSLL